MEDRKEVQQEPVIARQYQGEGLEPGEPIWIPEDEETKRPGHNLTLGQMTLDQIRERKYLQVKIPSEKPWLFLIREINSNYVSLERLSPQTSESRHAQKHPEEVLILEKP